MKISAIAAISKNRVLGKDNDLVWNLPADLQHFKNTTWGHHMIMGRKTFESFGKVLPGRISIIMSRKTGLDIPGAFVVHSLEEGYQVARDHGEEECFVIGGEEIFRQALPDIEKLYLTLIHEEFEGDTFFPELDMDEWKIESEDFHSADQKNPYDHTYYIYVRK